MSDRSACETRTLGSEQPIHFNGLPKGMEPKANLDDM